LQCPGALIPRTFPATLPNRNPAASHLRQLGSSAGRKSREEYLFCRSAKKIDPKKMTIFKRPASVDYQKPAGRRATHRDKRFLALSWNGRIHPAVCITRSIDGRNIITIYGKIY
jgi:hypothetical protein